MKKFILLFTIGLFATLSFGQKLTTPISTGENGVMITSNRSGELDCAANSVFGQAPVNSTTSLFSDEGTAYGSQHIYDNFSGLTEYIGGITFWGIMYDGGDCYTPGSQDFEITFFQDNAGSPGAMVQQPFSVTVTPTETGEFVSGVSILRYDINFPSSISLPSGWVSVVKLNPGNEPCSFAWLNTTNGDNTIAYNQGGGTISLANGYDVSFCLKAPAAVPVSNWALVISLLLISGFIVIRYRRRLA